MSVHDPESGSEFAFASIVILALFAAIVVWSVLLAAPAPTIQRTSHLVCTVDGQQLSDTSCLWVTP